ncbi:MAG: hypothetical protein FGM54_11295 [Chitinophagaceae bacterium]|nr:hypothetical protein [Chitinophagaceae bacterium]
MLFTRQYQFNCGKNPSSLRQCFLGKHVQIHQLDFEVFDEGDHLKVIPHTENSDQIYTLPITKLFISPNSEGTQVRMKFSPRQIDIGGPYLLLIFIGFAIISALLLLWFQTNIQTAYIIVAAAVLVFGMLWYRMEKGYFDYIRKIKNWVKTYAQE